MRPRDASALEDAGRDILRTTEPARATRTRTDEASSAGGDAIDAAQRARGTRRDSRHSVARPRPRRALERGFGGA